MGRQVRKNNPWHGLAYSHLGHNYYIARQYRWQSCKLILFNITRPFSW